MFNPVEPRLIATANSKEGVGLWDIRKPRRLDPDPTPAHRDTTVTYRCSNTLVTVVFLTLSSFLGVTEVVEIYFRIMLVSAIL